MRNKRHIYIANWKMAMPLTKARDFLEQNHRTLSLMAKNADIVICPSFVAIPLLSQPINNCNAFIGAQDCSEYESGAYTGQVNAGSLKEQGCSFCIVGHSERRSLMHETDMSIAKKIENLTRNHIQPILCIGEGFEDANTTIIEQILDEQLTLPIALMQRTPSAWCIAYEPVWAIGNGKTPSLEHINNAVTYIRQLVSKAGIDDRTRIVYGGSVTPENARSLMNNLAINGLLIGGASLDFQKFKNIVL